MKMKGKKWNWLDPSAILYGFLSSVLGFECAQKVYAKKVMSHACHLTIFTTILASWVLVIVEYVSQCVKVIKCDWERLGHLRVFW